ncbi:MAG: alpha-amylase [Actinobacteria bacterium]|nr:alpha-amylase [Actinomycetota bacterium]
MRRFVLLPALLVLVLALPACGSGGTPGSAAEAGLPWWSERVFYEIFVRSFKDADGDGIGDFRGLTASLDYLNDGDPATTTDLGITGIWLMPVFASPSYHGYDVTDYRAVNPDYGTMEDFRAFLAAAHDRGIAVLIDLVLNHTSDEHPWFEASAAGDPAYADWYLWREDSPGWRGPWNQQVWHRHEDRFYYALFWEKMPDLNLENPAVRDELYDVARYWLEEVGVDGFRIDAAKHLVERGPVQEDTVASRRWMADFTRFVHGVDPTALVLGEVWSPTAVTARYVPGPLDLVFDFDFGREGLSAALQTGLAGPLIDVLEELAGSYRPGRAATFLTNHDMTRVWTAVAAGAPPESVAPIVRLCATVLLTAPGTPFLYYGEEVGLAGDKPDERIRTPMPWTGEGPGVGFTSGTPWEEADSGYTERNVAVQDGDPESLLNLYRRLIHFRNGSPALRFGDLTTVETGNEGVAAYLRSAGDDHVLVVVNLTGGAVADYLLAVDGDALRGLDRAVVVAGGLAAGPAAGSSVGAPLGALPPFAALVLQLPPE